MLSAAACTNAPDSNRSPTPGRSSVTSTDARSAALPDRNANPTRERSRHRTLQVVATPQHWRLPEPVARAALAPSGRSVVVAGGLVQGDQSTADSYRVDLADGHVSRLPSLVVPVHDAAGTNLLGTPIVLGGGNSTEQSAVQTLRDPQRWQVVSRLPDRRADLVAIAVRRRLMVIGGYDGAHEAAGVLMSRDGLRFRRVGRLVLPVRYPAAVVWRGGVWVIGGERDGHMVAAVQRVDVPTGRCRVVGRLPQRIGHAAAVVVGGRILVMGGRTDPDTVTSALVWFDPRDGSSRPAGQLPYPLADTGVVATPDGAYLLGGETPQLTGRVVRVSAR